MRNTQDHNSTSNSFLVSASIICWRGGVVVVEDYKVVYSGTVPVKNKTAVALYMAS